MKNLFSSLKEWSLLVFLLITFCGFFYFDLHHYLTFNTIRTYHAQAQEWTVLHYLPAVSLYVLTLTVLIACGIPCATILTLLGGFLFGTIAILYAILGITFGGILLFFAIRTAFGARIAEKSTGWVKKLEHGFQQNAFSYLLMLRLVPILPCWIINVSAGALNVRVNTFVGATVIGIFPATIIYVMVGRGLDKFFSAEQSPNLSMVLTPSIFFPLLGLAILSLFPVFYKVLKKTP